jgi:hypothetical protein
MNIFLFLFHPAIRECDIRTEKMCRAGTKYTFWCNSGARIASGAVYLFMLPGAILVCWQARCQMRQLKNIFLMLRRTAREKMRASGGLPVQE